MRIAYRISSGFPGVRGGDVRFGDSDWELSSRPPGRAFAPLGPMIIGISFVEEEGSVCDAAWHHTWPFRYAKHFTVPVVRSLSLSLSACRALYKPFPRQLETVSEHKIKSFTSLARACVGFLEGAAAAAFPGQEENEPSSPPGPTSHHHHMSLATK